MFFGTNGCSFLQPNIKVANRLLPREALNLKSVHTLLNTNHQKLTRLITRAVFIIRISFEKHYIASSESFLIIFEGISGDPQISSYGTFAICILFFRVSCFSVDPVFLDRTVHISGLQKVATIRTTENMMCFKT